MKTRIEKIYEELVKIEIQKTKLVLELESIIEKEKKLENAVAA